MDLRSESLWRQARTIPNMLSILRLLLVPVFLVLILTDHNYWAIFVLAVASGTDFLDGKLARKFNQVTRLGQLLDPAADRLYIFATLIGLCVTGVLPLWMVLVIFGRDLLLFLVYPILATHGYGPLPVHFLGKAGTFALLYALPLLLLDSVWPAANMWLSPLAWAFAWWGMGLYWLAGFVYLKQVKDVVSSARRLG
ncbi:MAG: CDP-alcohol phosphatidyltransferase family protein [Micrococcales bacterium]